ncbi:restriction endonuclease [Thiothrix lacustris]|uniref:restriction endonuclease n=1 Tax=Thiothrix lacustris TaxID=525917 RepID=UPI0027E4C4F0|nr:restriction endonuclease [Thiothrix lacustris]WMP17756.1 restriction endonuclease [Thiothrix lacustris]
MSEENINSLDPLEQLELLSDFGDLTDKITSNEVPEPAKIELRKSFDILLSLLDNQITLSGIEKVRLVRELAKARSALEKNDLTTSERKRLDDRIKMVRFLLLTDEDQQKSIISSIVDSNQRILKNRLKEKLDNINPHTFERIIAKLLSFMGYANIEATKKSRDGGIDIVAYSDIGKLHRIKTVVQVKRIKANVGTPVVDNLRGAMNACGADRGLIITTSDFSKDCRKSTEHDSAL